ncbi:hypothetical protein [Methylomonas sp. AM2-LC]|uniref:hypothetical protein n=1 Tax=Methylomonas sp. AM2-LC TaxID=3153301 RepID=UPI003264017B
MTDEYIEINLRQYYRQKLIINILAVLVILPISIGLEAYSLKNSGDNFHNTFGYLGITGLIVYPLFIVKALNALGVINRIEQGVMHPDRMSWLFSNRLGAEKLIWFWTVLFFIAASISILLSKI